MSKRFFRKAGKYVKKQGNRLYKRYANDPSKLIADVKFLKSVVNPELKYCDKYLTEAVTTSGHIDPINLIAEGTAPYEREGISIKANAVFIRVGMKINQTTPTTCYVRTMLIRDQISNGSVPTIADLFETTSNILSPLKKSSTMRYRVYFDKIHQLDTYHGIKDFKKYIPLDFHMRYQGSGATQSDIEANGMYLVHWSDTTSNNPTLIWASRLTYYDN